MNDDISQDELNNLNLNQDNSVEGDIKNQIILIRNELNTLDTGIDYYIPKSKLRIKKKLNKILNEMINIRKN